MGAHSSSAILGWFFCYIGESLYILLQWQARKISDVVIFSRQLCVYGLFWDLLLCRIAVIFMGLYLFSVLLDLSLSLSPSSWFTKQNNLVEVLYFVFCLANDLARYCVYNLLSSIDILFSQFSVGVCDWLPETIFFRRRGKWRCWYARCGRCWRQYATAGPG